MKVMKRICSAVTRSRIVKPENMYTIFCQVKFWRPWSPAVLWHENPTPSFPSPRCQPRGTFTVPWQGQAEGPGAHDSRNNSRGHWNRESCMIRVWESSSSRNFAFCFWPEQLGQNLCFLLSLLFTLQASPEDSFVSADALLNRISKKASICDQPEYLDPDLAEKNPPVFAQKLQVCSRNTNVLFFLFVHTQAKECFASSKRGGGRLGGDVEKN